MHSVVGADEVVGVVGLQDAGDVLVHPVADIRHLAVVAVVEVYQVAGAEPYLPPVVHIAVADGGIVLLVGLLGKLVGQAEAVVPGIVAEDASLLADFPQHSFRVQVEPVQVDGRVEFFLSVHQLVVLEVFSIVAVEAFGRQEPHVAFPVLLDGIHLPVAQSVFHTYIFIGLCADDGGQQIQDNNQQDILLHDGQAANGMVSKWDKCPLQGKTEVKRMYQKNEKVSMSCHCMLMNFFILIHPLS